jgi:hypothetical protein
VISSTAPATIPILNLSNDEWRTAMLNRKYVLVGATAVIGLLVVATVEVASHPREYAVDQQTFKFERPASFETTLIYGSDASVSTFGLDSTHSTDW